jgi:hypothetical protein
MMKWRKEIVAHDELCNFEPCICSELESLRELKAAKKAITEMRERHALAVKALEGEA